MGERNWAYFTSTLDKPDQHDYRVEKVDALVVMLVDPNGHVHYDLQLPEWKIRQAVNKMFEDWQYMRKIDKE